ncbi:MAG TPA: hypothetical protein VMM93_08560 [Vicinamibacterales bacterium]|nr:hypothetical protein [Vicinamibacterales bacterium]
MHVHIATASRRVGLGLIGAALIFFAATPAQAQISERESSRRPLGADYRIEFSGTLWYPTLNGVISSEQFGIIGDQIEFTTDLGYQQTRFGDMRLVLRPSRKSKFRVQYTPITYRASTDFKRDIVFNGIKFPVAIPVESTFEWKVLRIGYEYDFVSTSRGFVGLLLEGRYTQFRSELTSVVADEFSVVKVPLPAIGAVGRVYVIPEVAVDFEVSAFKFPDVDPKYQANYFDWDIHGTFNFTDNVGVQVGWRRMTSFINIEQDTGDLKFQGMWFGAAVRY